MPMGISMQWKKIARTNAVQPDPAEWEEWDNTVVDGKPSLAVGLTDRALFVGFKIPEEIKSMIHCIISTRLDRPTFQEILKAVLNGLEGRTINLNKLEDSTSVILNQDNLPIVISGLHRMLQLAFRKTIKSPEILTEDLTDLKIPKEFIPDIVSAVFGQKRTVLLRRFVESGPHLPKLSSFKWRVDVGISTGVLSRVLEPTVMMEMSLSNGEVHKFEVPMQKFHELRYNVSYVLKEMEDVEKRSILKIQD